MINREKDTWHILLLRFGYTLWLYFSAELPL